MSKSIQQIEQELTATEKAVIDIGKELEEAYRVYLKLLSETTKKQFLLGSYYICTQIYPESFLNLNKKKQEIIQQTLIQIGKIIEVLFYQYILEIFKLYRSNAASNTSSVSETKQAATEPLVEESLASKPSDNRNLTQDNPDRGNSEETVNASRLERDKNNPDIIKLNLPNSNNINNLVSIAALIENSDQSAETLNNFKETFQETLQIISSPEDLLRCHKQIEQAINKSLEILSLEANKKLQQAGILSQKVPAQLLEIPLLSGDAGTPVRGLPHLLELNIEMGNSSNNSKDAENKIFAKIILLRLKIAEIEFIDFNLAKERERIRKLIVELDRLRHLYSHLKKEYLIARAERDWRSIWYEN
jgi:hypothetical protein